MKVFVCSRSTDSKYTNKIIQEIESVSENSIALFQEIEHSDTWKDIVEKKIAASDFVLFILGQDSFDSEQLKWELSTAKNINKPIIGIKLNNVSSQSLTEFDGFHVFEETGHCVKYLTKSFEERKKLRLEQYKIMISSTEKVTDSRLKVNNLFFTLTSSIISVAFVLGKSFNFSNASVFAMFILTVLGVIVTYFWEKLVNSYGQLNTGKFMVIDKIEKELRTNMFEDEWQILTKEINYEPNTRTETKIIIYFRYLILTTGIIELFYLLIPLLSSLFKCHC